jgi:hypothetical protein
MPAYGTPHGESLTSVPGESIPRQERRSQVRKLIVSELVSLDGVKRAPGGADEDTEGGFQHGGWTR